MTTNVLLTWQPTEQPLLVLPFLVKLRPWAQRLSQVWQPKYVQRPCQLNDLTFYKMSCCQKGIGPGIWHKFIYSPCLTLFSIFFMNGESSAKTYCHLLEVTAAHSDRKRRHWIFCSRSYFWREISRGGSLHKFTCVWVVHLFAHAMPTINTDFILCCFQQDSAMVQ